jgi:hypothetical protein
MRGEAQQMTERNESAIEGSVTVRLLQLTPWYEQQVS